MRQIDVYPHFVVRHALLFSALTFCRPGEIAGALWDEVDVGRGEWVIPDRRMKMRRPHIVPLSRQAVAVLEGVREAGGGSVYVFPAAHDRKKHMQTTAVNYALRYMGYSGDVMCAHGFRGMASTILYGHGFGRDVVERQLAHVERSAVVAAYNHAEYLPQRREMMEWWGDWLDSVRGY
jgi:integrase